MKKFLSYIHWRHLKHLYHVERKQLPHYHRLLQSFLHSRNGKLIVILFIAAMIPMTVLGVQTVQNLRQEAAGPNVPKAACDGASTGLLAEPRPAIKDQKIVFKHASGLPPINQQSFDEWDSLGNGVYPDSDEAKKCKLVGDSIECIARGTAKAGQISKHTWKFRELAVCEYEVKNAAPKSTPTPTKNPDGTPRPTRIGGTTPTETPGPNAGFDADIEADGCNANKIARLKIKWDLSSQTKDCSITIEGGGQKETRTGCTSENLIYDALPKDSSNDLKSKTKYVLTIKSAEKIKGVDATTAECVKPENTPTPTLKAGQPTPTSASGQSTCKILSAATSCTTNKKPSVTATWEVDGTNCQIGLYKSGSTEAIGGVKTNCKSGTDTGSINAKDLEKGKTYIVKAKSSKCTEITKSVTIPANACTTQTTNTISAGSDGACESKSINGVIKCVIKGTDQQGTCPAVCP